MKNVGKVLIATLVILGIILLSNAFILGSLCYFFSPEVILGDHNDVKCVSIASEITVQLPCHEPQNPPIK